MYHVRNETNLNWEIKCLRFCKKSNILVLHCLKITQLILSFLFSHKEVA